MHLQERLRELLAPDLGSLDPVQLQFGLDFTLLLVRSRSAKLDEQEKQTLAEALSSSVELPAEARQRLLDLVLDPLYRHRLPPEDLEAYGYRFGHGATKNLIAERGDEIDLQGFSSRYGPEEALLLLDAMFKVSAADGHIDPQEARELERSAQQLGVDVMLVSALFQRYDPSHAEGELLFPIQGDQVKVGRGPGNDVILTDPQVARHHCTFLRLDGAGWRLVDAGSGRQVLLDGTPVSSAPVGPENAIQIGPWTLFISDQHIRAISKRRFTALSAQQLTRHIGPISLLNDVSFTAFSGELIALVGPSGAGKTTLINAIANIAPADTGRVLLNGEDFHPVIAQDPSVIGIVPQDDLVHPELKVHESLYYSGRMRADSSVQDDTIRGEVDRVLRELDIDHIRDSRIGDATKRGISGGQRKRVNLGQDLLSRSIRVLFLDEPTSGLDPRSAQSIVSQIRRLADGGRLVFLVTHDLSPGILAQVDHLLVMLPGGYLGYFGPPASACQFFGAPTPDMIFDRLSDHSPEEWAQRYRESPSYSTYVATREFLLERRGSEAKGGEDTAAEPALRPASDQLTPAKPSAWVQFMTQTRRYARIKFRDRDGLGVLMLQPLVLALFIILVFPEPTFRLIFMLSLSCLWFGMSAAVRELISDRTIWTRERRVGVGVSPYLCAKVLVLTLIGTLQASLMIGIVHFSMGLSELGFGMMEMMGVGALTAGVGLSLGLLVSASYSSSEAAVGTLPLLLIPQICFCSVMVSIRDMNAIAKAITWVTPQRYAFDLMMKIGDQLSGPTRIPGEFKNKSITGPLYELGLKGSGVDDMGLVATDLVGCLSLFSAVFLIGTWIIIYRREQS